MKRLGYHIITLLLVTIWIGCGSHKTEEQASSYKLKAPAFADTLAKSENLQLVDVRTPEEFEKGHIEGATNIDWNDTDFFTEQIVLLDTTKPVFVYCLSGGRSKKAVEKLHHAGFDQVYELQGGMLEWRANNLPEHTGP